MSSSSIELISECFIRPKHVPQNSTKPHYLAPMDLVSLSTPYIQNGLLFTKSSQYSTNKFLEGLKSSLSNTLVHFYPLAGQLVTQVNEEKHESLIFIDCNKDQGARFIHATLGITIDDLLSLVDVPPIIQSLFDRHHGYNVVNYDGHNQPLLSIQVTELIDGIFIGCSMNHMVVDGASYWNFWNVWSNIHMQSEGEEIPLVPTLLRPVITSHRWLPEGELYRPIALPFTHPDQFITRYEPTNSQLCQRIFHFSSISISKLKEKANDASNDNSNEISSLQALSALLWRSIVRAYNLPHNQLTRFMLAANNRHRLNPQLPQTYFGNSTSAIKTNCTVGELLKHDVRWVASLLHRSVEDHSDDKIRGYVQRWLTSPFVYHIDGAGSKEIDILVTNSPRFDVYGNEFGLGKPLAVRSGYADRVDGVIAAFPGYEGKGTIDIQICLPFVSMAALVLDKDFMSAIAL